MRKLFISFLLLSCGVTLFADKYPRIPQNDVIHYEFNIFLNDSTDRIEGSTLIKVLLTKSDSVVFDLKNEDKSGKGMHVSEVSMNGKKIEWKHSNDRLVIHFKTALSGNYEFAIEYSGIPADGLIISKNKFGDRVFFADHWPDRAHNYLPCVDHPYDKATVDFLITAPAHYKVVASGAQKEITSAGNYITTHWSESQPLPVKIMAFGAASFSVTDAGNVKGIPVTTWVFPQNSAEGANDYGVAVKPLAYYIDLIGEFPFEKLANVQSKTIYGGLENASCIFYSERSVTGNGRAESLIAHEIAHQWFGDCVTELDWNHVWLSEGFATYLTSMYFESINGKEALKKDLSATRERILKYWERNKKPVIDTTVTDLMSLLNVNSYQKGAWVLHMLRNEVGDEPFRKGLRLFYSRYRNSNALTEYLCRVMEEASGKDLDYFFEQWLYTPGQPELKIRQEPGKRGKIDIIIEQQQENLFRFNIDLKITGPSVETILTVPVKDRTTRISVKSAEKLQVIPDPETKLLYRLVSVE
jgi:aminopeptidase N